MDTKNFIAEKLDRDELIRLIEYHNRRYWDEGEPEIPDARYDELIRALQKLEPDHELVTRVYAPAVAGSGKVRHLRPMLSLDKAYSLEEVLEWAKKFARSEDEELLVRRINEAAQYVPLEDLCLSPQCGFASCECGNKLTEEEQWAKVALVQRVAKRVWGED